LDSKVIPVRNTSKVFSVLYIMYSIIFYMVMYISNCMQQYISFLVNIFEKQTDDTSVFGTL